MLLVKYIPIMQMVGMLLNNSLYFSDVYNICYIIDFIVGNSVVTMLFLYICSIVFHFCEWHRIIIITNAICLFLAVLDSQINLQVSDVQLLVSYHIIACAGVLSAISSYLYEQRNKSKNTYTKEVT